MLAGPVLGQSFEILATVKLGQATTTELKESLKKDSCEFSNFGDRTPATLIDQTGFSISQKTEDCILGITNPTKLGFVLKKNGVVTQSQVADSIIGKKVVINGKTYTVELCPAEAAPLLRIAYKNTNKKCSYDIKTPIMNPIMDSDGQMKIFRLVTGKPYRALKACTYEYSKNLKEPFFYSDSELVFRLVPVPSL